MRVIYPTFYNLYLEYSEGCWNTPEIGQKTLNVFIFFYLKVWSGGCLAVFHLAFFIWLAIAATTTFSWWRESKNCVFVTKKLKEKCLQTNYLGIDCYWTVKIDDFGFSFLLVVVHKWKICCRMLLYWGAATVAAPGAQIEKWLQCDEE